MLSLVLSVTLIFLCNAKQYEPVVETIPIPSSSLAKPLPADNSNWQTLLVNEQHPLPSNFTVQLTQIESNQWVDTRIADNLQEMLSDCRSAGLCPIICSSYRTYETQQNLFQNKIQRLMEEGYTESASILKP